MKKLFVIALLAASVVGMAEARCRTNSCEPRECAQKSCIRPACIVNCTTDVCEGPKPQLCALEPARVDIVKHTNINHSYSCAPLKACQVKPSQEQVDALIDMGAVPADTKACP